MTLSSVPRYDPPGLSSIGGHAAVIGGSVAGLVTARVLSDAYEEVTVIERDALPDGTSPRRGVPQGRHIHVLETAGRDTFEDLFPGYGEDLLSSGGLIVDLMSDFHHYEKGDFLANGPKRMTMYSATRPLFEKVLRERVAGLDGVELLSETQFVEYVLDESGTGVAGVVLRGDDSAETALAADLVVDASGRTSRTPTWLEDNGFEAPSADEVAIDVAYSTCGIERPPDDRRTFFVPPEPGRLRGVGMFPVEGERWQATIVGVHGDHPPTEKEELIEFAQSLPVPVIGELLAEQSWTTDEVTHYPFPSNRRLRYEELQTFPENLIVIGDAICSFNPIYGQGMSVAALEALQLHHTLASDGRGVDASAFFEGAAEITDAPWSIAVGGDFEFDATTGPKPRGTDLINWYLDKYIRAAQSDGILREQLVKVFMLEEAPSSLMGPRKLWRVFGPT